MNWNKLLSMVIKKIKAKYKPDIIVIAMNGGLVPGGFIAAALNIKDVRPVSIGRKGNKRFFIYPKNGNIGNIKGKKILIIEDDVPTGLSIKLAKDTFFARGAKDVKTACVFIARGVEGIEFYAKEVSIFPRYPWKITNTGDRF